MRCSSFSATDSSMRVARARARDRWRGGGGAGGGGGGGDEAPRRGGPAPRAGGTLGAVVCVGVDRSVEGVGGGGRGRWSWLRVWRGGGRCNVASHCFGYWR